MGPSWGSCGPSWGPWGCLGGLGGASLEVLGGSLGVLGGLFGGLGRVLGGYWGSSCALSGERKQFKHDFEKYQKTIVKPLILGLRSSILRWPAWLGSVAGATCSQVVTTRVEDASLEGQRARKGGRPVEGTKGPPAPP